MCIVLKNETTIGAVTVFLIREDCRLDESEYVLDIESLCDSVCCNEPEV